ncbi:MAG: hypothetical protein ACRD0V_02200 [Acidimicrobiales bacterium]
MSMPRVVGLALSSTAVTVGVVTVRAGGNTVETAHTVTPRRGVADPAVTPPPPAAGPVADLWAAATASAWDAGPRGPR